jgi:hypothetical protein
MLDDSLIESGPFHRRLLQSPGNIGYYGSAATSSASTQFAVWFGAMRVVAAAMRNFLDAPLQ